MYNKNIDKRRYRKNNKQSNKSLDHARRLKIIHNILSLSIVEYLASDLLQGRDKGHGGYSSGI